MGFKDIKYDISVYQKWNTQIHKYANTQNTPSDGIRTLFVAFIERVITFLFLQHMDALELLMAGNFWSLAKVAGKMDGRRYFVEILWVAPPDVTS